MKAETLLSSWENPQDVSRANLVFEKRNKNYGGYFIRVYYPERIFRAFLFAVFGFVILVSAPVMMEKYFSHSASVANPDRDYVITLIQPPAIDKPIIPPSIQKEEIKKQLTKTTEWIRPKVVDDIQNTDDVKSQEELSKTTLGTETIKTDDTEEIKIETVLPPVDNKTYNGWEVQEMPIFPGGDKALVKYLHGIRYPRPAIDEGIKGTVYVSFVVDKEGKIVNAKVVKGIGWGCDEEAIRVVKAMPLWKPGKQNGNPVPVQFNLPVNFNLRNSF